MTLRHTVLLIILLAFGAKTMAIELSLARVQADLGAQAVDITVIEKHLNDPHARVTYRGIPLRAVLEKYFPDQWPKFSGDIRFVARDGYKSRIAAERARSRDAYIAFARADGKPFLLDNVLQNETNVHLDPFYLVWDNIKHKDLLNELPSSWPYQVIEIQLISVSADKPPLPVNASAAVLKGYEAYITHCLTCHQINGVGGRKDERDMQELVAGKSREDLARWIDNPQGENPATSMPPLEPLHDSNTRTQVINQIIDYLGTL